MEVSPISGLPSVVKEKIPLIFLVSFLSANEGNSQLVSLCAPSKSSALQSTKEGISIASFGFKSSSDSKILGS